jgi:hypothetical protein
MARGMASHERSADSSVIWLTPPKILRFLGSFDLDPCAAPSPRPWSTAARHIELPEDGLLADWHGRVWLNPPYGKDQGMDAWIEKMAKHKSGIALIFAKTDTEVWSRWVWPFCSSVLFVQGRLAFYLPDGTKKDGAGGPSALIAWSPEDTAILSSSGIRGGHVCLLSKRGEEIDVPA